MDAPADGGSNPEGEPPVTDRLWLGRWLNPDAAPVLEMLYVA
jgi:hypothetical protein